MTVTAPQVSHRLQGVGASEVAAVLGLDPFKTALDLYLLKRGLGGEQPENEHMHFGNVMEPLLIAEYANRAAKGARSVTTEELRGWFGEQALPAPREGQVTVRHPLHPWLFATPDDVLSIPDGTPLGVVRGVEVKNRASRGASFWGESGSDEIPDAVVLQCQAGMMCTGFREWGVAVYFGGADFRTYLLRADDDIHEAIERGVAAFWFDHVQAEVPPEVTRGDERTHKTLAALFRRHDEELLAADEATTELLRDYFTVRAVREESEGEEKLLEAKLKAIIGAHAGLQGSPGKLSWKATKDSERIEWEAAARNLGQLTGQESFERIVAAHTATRPGSRRFLATPAKGGA